MSLLKNIVTIAVFMLSSLVMLPSAHAEKYLAHFINDDDTFQALRNAARNDDSARAINYASQLTSYPLPSYVEYYRLKPRLRTASTDEILDFLKRYDGTVIAERLRTDWLLDLGRQRDWTTFDEQYALLVQKDGLQTKCFALMSQALKGQNVADDARTLLTAPDDYGEPCNALVATLVQLGQFSDDDVWMQIRLAAEIGYVPSARRLSALTETSGKTIEQAIEKPALVLKKKLLGGRESHQVFIIALGRIARTDLNRAVQELSASSSKLTAQERALAWGQIALRASHQLAPQTWSEYWSKTDDAPLSSEGYQWRARMALRTGNWMTVKSTIDAMPASLREMPVWVYWRGRALKAQGDNEEANVLFRSISDRVHFYGQLASEELGQMISFPQAAKPVTEAELAPLAANAGFSRALKLFDLNLRTEAIREWNWELRKMSERELLASAEFARQNGMLDRMVNTSDRTNEEVDFSQRYPTPFLNIMYNATNVLGLDMAWVYGLIRQESRFVMNARSHVGASGLMQLMPATAKFVAQKIGMTDFNKETVNHIDTNIQLGTNYLNMVLANVDGSQALATAAYNAGPRRPIAWRATLTRPVEGAIFAETIPFTETRGYVKNVLANATYYAALLQGKPQSLKARLGTVTPNPS